MRIAFISYEYAGGPNGGGIGTYVRNAANMLAARGHWVEVFTSGEVAGSETIAIGLEIHSVRSDRKSFPQRILPAFSQRHATHAFDVIEGPEYGIDAAEIAHAHPNVPIVVKLHTPAFIIDEINRNYMRIADKARFIVGALRRGQFPQPFWRTVDGPDREREHVRAADVITAPSCAILHRLAADWGLAADQMFFIPNVFEPQTELLQIRSDIRTNRVLFLGRLEVRKGVLELATAASIVCRHHSSVRFIFVGQSSPYPGSTIDVKSMMIDRLGSSRSAVQFVKAVPYKQIPELLEDCDICVAPSVWENFPNVCLEAMAAARGVVGSSAGGMAEIIDHGRTGLLVPPRNPEAIAAAINRLLRNPEQRMAMGRAAREHVLSAYSSEVIAPLQEASYRRAIERAKIRNAAA